MLFTCAVFVCAHAQDKAAADKPVPAAEEQRINIINYGTDTEIANLLKTLRTEQQASGAEAADSKSSSPDNPVEKALAALAEKTQNKNILPGIFSFFADRKKTSLEERAVRAVEARDDEAFETVSAAIDYLGRLEFPGAVETLTDILNSEESRFMNSSIRALGRIAKKDDPEKAADFLVDYYTNKDPGDENRREIIIAVGAAGSKKAVPFLASIAENNDERVPLRMAALDGLALIGDKEGLGAILNAASSKDPNVRSSAIAALGPFDGDKTDAAVLEAFRDSYYRTRIAAAKAARERKLESAVPYLVFRTENDDVPAVRDESIKALGAIASSNGDAKKALEKLFSERNTGDRLRIAAAEALLADSGSYTGKVIEEMDYAKSKNQNALYNGFLRALGNAKTGSLEDLARRFFTSGSVIEQSYALDICLNNNFRGFAEEVRALAESKNGSLAIKSKRVLESWGL